MAIDYVSDCPYCERSGCGECDGTGERHTTILREGELSATIHGSAELSPESEDALRAVMRAAYAQMVDPGSESRQ